MSHFRKEGCHERRTDKILFLRSRGGVSMGFGTYCVMPIPVGLAIGWCLGSVVECLVAGLLVGLILKADKKAVSDQ